MHFGSHLHNLLYVDAWKWKQHMPESIQVMHALNPHAMEATVVLELQNYVLWNAWWKEQVSCALRSFLLSDGIVSGIIWTHLHRQGNNPSTCPVCYQLLSSPKTSGPALESTQTSIHRVPGVIFREGKACRSWNWRLIPRLVSKLRMGWTTHPLPYMLSWSTQGRLYVY